MFQDFMREGPRPFSVHPSIKSSSLPLLCFIRPSPWCTYFPLRTSSWMLVSLAPKNPAQKKMPQQTSEGSSWVICLRQGSEPSWEKDRWLSPFSTLAEEAPEEVREWGEVCSLLSGRQVYDWLRMIMIKSFLFNRWHLLRINQCSSTSPTKKLLLPPLHHSISRGGDSCRIYSLLGQLSCLLSLP